MILICCDYDMLYVIIYDIWFMNYKLLPPQVVDIYVTLVDQLVRESESLDNLVLLLTGLEQTELLERIGNARNFPYYSVFSFEFVVCVIIFSTSDIRFYFCWSHALTLFPLSSIGYANRHSGHLKNGLFSKKWVSSLHFLSHSILILPFAFRFHCYIVVRFPVTFMLDSWPLLLSLVMASLFSSMSILPGRSSRR